MPNFTLPDEVFERAARIFPTPFHLYDERGIRENARGLNEAFSFADFKEYFAVKALPNPAILNLLREESCGADCASECELLLAAACGMRGEEIMFSANDMPPSELALARELNAFINLDDMTHIDDLAGNGGVPETVCVRYNPGGDMRVGNHIMGSPGDAKFGWTRGQLTEGLKKLRGMSARAFGLHAFLASNVLDEEYYPALAQELMRTGRELENETGLTLAFLNLSGGIGVPYLPNDAPADPARIAKGVEKAYIKAFGPYAPGKPAIKTELGRYMTGPFGWLVTRAIHEKNTYKRYIGVDACAANLMRPAMYGAYHHISVCGKRDLPASEKVDVVGSLCENNDKFAVDRMLPHIDQGDLLLIHDTGAHGHSMGYQYNGRLRSAEILYCENDTFRLIRRAETPADYFATLV